MKQENLRRLTNHFRDVRLISLRNWRAANEITPRDPGGPYIVAQEGYDPADLRMQTDEFVLGRSGKWLSVGLFLKLPLETRRGAFVFGTAAEFMGLVQDLPSRAEVLRPEIEPERAAVPEQDELNATFISSERHALPGFLPERLKAGANDVIPRAAYGSQ